MICETPTEAYLASTETRKDQCERLYRLYKAHNGLTDKEAAELMGWGRLAGAKVSARRPDINKDPRYGKIVELGKRLDPSTGVRVKVYGVAQDTLFRIHYNDL